MTTLYFIENRFASRSQNGFTLVELIITIVLVGIIATFTTLFMYTGLNSYLRAKDTSEGALKAQIALDRISLELRDIDTINAELELGLPGERMPGPEAGEAADTDEADDSRVVQLAVDSPEETGNSETLH